MVTREDILPRVQIFMTQRPFDSRDLDDIIKEVITPGSTSARSSPHELLYLDILTSDTVLSRLLKSGVSSTMLACFDKNARMIANDSRNSLGERDDYVQECERVARSYIGLLAQDVGKLAQEYRVPEDALEAYIHYATVTCLMGRREHNHVPESARLGNYVRARQKVFKLATTDKSPALAKKITGIFESAVYGDGHSGLTETRWVHARINPDLSVDYLSEEHS